jgi:hypothetical protein
LIEELNHRENKIAMLNNDIKKKEDIIQANQRVRRDNSLYIGLPISTG